MTNPLFSPSDPDGEWRQPRPAWCRTMDLPVDLGGYAFNPTLLRTAAGLACIYRHVCPSGQRTLRRCLLDSDHRAEGYSVWSNEVRQLGSEVSWFADPRVFKAGDEQYVSFNTGYSSQQNEIYIAKIDDQGAPLSLPIKLIKPDGRRKVEKNWGLFYEAGCIYAIYSISPFVVLKLEFDGNAAICHPASAHAWDSEHIEARYGELHGGAAPCMIGERGYFVAQSNTPSARGKIYSGTIVTFARRFPFQPLAAAPAPLFTLSTEEASLLPSTPLNPKVATCLYPCGAEYESAADALTICYGINDYRSGIRRYAIDEIDAALSPATLYNA